MSIASTFIPPSVVQSLEYLVNLQATNTGPANVETAFQQWKDGTNALYQALIAGADTTNPLFLMGSYFGQNVRGQVSGDPQTALVSLQSILAKHGFLLQPSEGAQAVQMRLTYATALYHLRRLSREEETSVAPYEATQALQNVLVFFKIKPATQNVIQRITTDWQKTPPTREDIVAFLTRLKRDQLVPPDFWSHSENILPFVAGVLQPQSPLRVTTELSHPLPSTQMGFRGDSVPDAPEDVIHLLVKKALKRATGNDQRQPSNIATMTTPTGYLKARALVIVGDTTGRHEEETEGAIVTSYKITGLIGSGGAGTIYAGEEWQRQIDGPPVFVRRVVVKITPTTPDYLKMCRTEWLCHAGGRSSDLIVAAIAQGITTTGEQFMVLEEMAGGNLRDNISRLLYFPPFRKAMEIIIRTVAAAVIIQDGEEGYIHRDLKLENILLDRPMDEGALSKLTDFGTATLDSPNNPRLNDLVGTPPYMAPEIAKGDRATKRSDVFSLAMIAYELLTGKTPFLDGESTEPMARVAQALHNMREVFERAEGITFPEGSKVPPDLQKIIVTALSEDPQKRPADARTFLLQLLTYKVKACERRDRQADAVREQERVEEQLTAFGLSTPDTRETLALKAYAVWLEANGADDDYDDGLLEEMARIVSDYEPIPGGPLTRKVEEPVRFKIKLDQPAPPNAIGSQVTLTRYESVDGVRTAVSQNTSKLSESSTPRGDTRIVLMLYRREGGSKIPVAREIACPLPLRPSSQHPTSPSDYYRLNFPVVTESDPIPNDFLIFPKGSVAFGDDSIHVPSFAMRNKITNAAYFRWLERLFFSGDKKEIDEILSKLPKHWHRNLVDILRELWSAQALDTHRYQTDPFFSYLALDQPGFFKTQSGVILHPEAAVTQFDYTDGLECLQGLYGEKARYPTPEEVLLAAIGPWSDRRFPWGKTRIPDEAHVKEHIREGRYGWMVGGHQFKAPPPNHTKTCDYSPYSLDHQQLTWLVSGTATFCHLRPNQSDLPFLFQHLDPIDSSQVTLAREWDRTTSGLGSHSLGMALRKSRQKNLLGMHVPVMGYAYHERPPDRIDVVRLADRTGKVGINPVETGMFVVIPL